MNLDTYIQKLRTAADALDALRTCGIVGKRPYTKAAPSNDTPATAAKIRAKMKVNAVTRQATVKPSKPSRNGIWTPERRLKHAAKMRKVVKARWAAKRAALEGRSL